MAHETFGDYLLLKKLSEDALGEVFRAGRLRDGNLERVVLLRTFNGRSLDTNNVAQTIRERKQAQAVLKSPNLGQGLDAGDIQGIPYIAYDYISGHDLGSLMRQAAMRSHPVPSEHALLIAERIALGLSVAHGSRVGNDRILHGFLIPQFVMLSNEGENRLLGFEASPALRATDAGSELWSTFGRYLSPESHAGAPISPTDDVYSLGVILLELLVGHTLDNLGPSALQGAIAQVAGRGLPNVAGLLEKSVAPQEQRIENAAVWHENLNRLALDNQSSSTPFHLAFYMHNLFREEIEKESEEIEFEKSIDFSKQNLTSSVPLGTATTATAAPTPSSQASLATVGASTNSGDVLSATDSGTIAAQTAVATGAAASSAKAPTAQTGTKTTAPKPTAKKADDQKSNLKVPLLVAAIVLVLGAAGYFAWTKFGSSLGGSPTDEVASTDSDTPPVLAATTSAGLDTTTDDTSGSTDETSAAGSAFPIGQVADAREFAEGVEPDTVDAAAVQREGDRERLMAELDRLVDERTKTAANDLKQTYDSEVQRLRDQLAEVERQKQEEERLAKEAEAARKKAEADRLAEEEKQRQAAEAEKQRKAAEAEQARKEEEAKKQTEASAEAPQRKIRQGELVQAGPGVNRPRLSAELRPVYPFAAQRLRREADVDVEVLVDENGKVVDTRMGTKAGFGFDEAARTAASRAQFTPATAQGVKVKMWTTLKVRFRLDNN